MSNEMTYKKCIHCEHVNRYYGMGGGLYLVCLITGKSMLIADKCVQDTEAEDSIAFDKEIEEELSEEKECKCKSCKRKGCGNIEQ